MKRIVLSAIALSMLAVPTVGAQAAPFMPAPVDTTMVQQVAQKHVTKKIVTKRVERRNGVRTVERRTVVKHRWARGKRVPEWQRRQFVNDYRRYGLHRPSRGQHWVKVDNDYLLVGIASGIVAGIIAAR